MTGVHWLLAHCSVLKVRARPVDQPSPDSPGQAEGRRLAAGGPDASGLFDRLRQAHSSLSSVVREMAPIRGPPSRASPGAASMVRPSIRARQPGGHPPEVAGPGLDAVPWSHPNELSTTDLYHLAFEVF